MRPPDPSTPPDHPGVRPAVPPGAHPGARHARRPAGPLAVLLAILLGLASTALLWWLPNRPQAADVPMVQERFNSVSFAPYRDGQSPLRRIYPTPEEVDSDLALVAQRVRAVRTYASLEGGYDVPALAERHGLRVWQGAWLGSDRARNERELAAVIASANRHPGTVERVIVGNEVLLRRDLPVAELTAAIDRVRAAVRQPVTYADVWEFWEQFPEVARHVDVITIHILPYWEDHPTGVAAAMAHIRDVYRRMQALFPGKRIAIGEVGWPSRGRWREDAAPSRVEQAVFLREFIRLAGQEGFDYNLIEAFDQGWKYKSEGTVGAAWGLWTADRQPTFPLRGGVVENPLWPVYAAAGGGIGLLLFLASLWLGPAPPAERATRSQAALGLASFALGNALAYAWLGTVPYAFDEHLAICAAFNLAGQALLAALLLRRLAKLLAGGPLAPARTGAEASETVRRLLTGRLRFGTWRLWALDDLMFVFTWTACVLQLLLLFDPRYRDFPFPTFAVPLVAVLLRAALRDLPRGGGGREEWAVGGVLVLAALGSAVREGPHNLQAMLWTACALVLAAPPLLRCRRTAPVRQKVAAPEGA
ncbi:glycoside hydrolase [Roseomonas sp. NAR14]|uniref:Endo-1,3-beta-glucanase btgC n=1 Tax=Roseomonas acroporae TaxID=2937791 RepID=A0A9X1Y7C3_9PROT|nr:glycoside hydrolase [Roseomonas acroporae]MCK8783392.1 glycoside hydrolase [Roseomonas acroporae]